jgi:hypothetical protein
MKNILFRLSVVLAAVTYTYLVITASLDTGAGLSFSTYALWAALAWIVYFAMKKRGANPNVVLVYALGSTSTTIVLLIKGRFGWSPMESFVAFLVILCIYVWFSKGAKWAIVFSVAAGTIASIPLIWMTWKDPSSSRALANSSFLLVNILAFISAKAWTLEDRLYSVANIIVCVLLVIPVIPWTH